MLLPQRRLRGGGESAHAMNCHCSNRSRATGAAFKPFAGIPRDQLRVNRGGDLPDDCRRRDYHDAHCARCGSRVRDGQWLHVAMGTLVDAPSIRPSAHVFVGLRRLGARLRTICRNIWSTSGESDGFARPFMANRISVGATNHEGVLACRRRPFVTSITSAGGGCC